MFIGRKNVNMQMNKFWNEKNLHRDHITSAKEKNTLLYLSTLTDEDMQIIYRSL